MKIEDIKPGDVIVRTEDGMVNKVAEVTPDGLILRSAYTDMEKCFHVFLNPDSSKLTADHYESATEEQRQYMDSKLADFYGTNAEVASKRFIALATMMGDLKQENIELAERVKQLMNDYNKVAKQLRNQPLLSNFVEALDKVEKLERKRDLFKKAYEQTERIYESLFNQHDLQSKELNAVREERDEAKEQYKDLQQKYEELSQQLNTANSKYKCADKRLDEADEEYYTLSSLLEGAESRIARFEKSTFERMEHDCPYGVKAKVGSLVCFNCEHHIKSDFGNTKTVLCAYTYDKKKEKEQYLDKFHEQMNRDLNSEKQ